MSVVDDKCRTSTGLSADLNHGSFKSPEVFLCYRRGRDKPPLVDVGGTPTLPPNTLVVTDICVIIPSKMETPPADFAFPRSVPIFCLPMGATLEAWPVNVQRPSPIFSTFVLTVSDAAEKVENEEDHKLLDLEDSQRSERTVFIMPPEPAPGSHAVYSYQDGFRLDPALFHYNRDRPPPHHLDLQAAPTGTPGSPMARRTKQEIKVAVKLAAQCASAPELWGKCLLSTCHSSLDRMISHLLEDIPFPSVHRPRILVQLSLTERLILTQPEDLPLPRSGASFRQLLLNLGPDNTLLLLLCALTEQKLLIHSLRPDVLTSVAEAVSMVSADSGILVLLWVNLGPDNTLLLTEQKLLIHSLRPDVLTSVAEAVSMVSADSGILLLLWVNLGPDNTILLTEQKLLIHSLRIFYSILNQSCFRCEDKRYLTIKLLPKRPARTLRHTLTHLYHKLLMLVRKLHNNNVEDLAVTASRKNRSNSVADLPGKQNSIDADFKIKRQEQLLELEIQEAFLRFMASVLKGYRGYLLPIIKAPTVGATDTSSLFDLEGFLRSRDRANHKFFSMISRTQMFIRFIEERSLVSDMDTGLAFFDECTEKVENEEDHKLLDLEDSQRSERTVFIMPPEPAPGSHAVYSYQPRLSADLNHGSFKSPEVFLCYRRGRDKPPLVDVGIMFDGKEKILPDSEIVSKTPEGRCANVNNSTARTFVTYRRAPPTLPPNTLVVTDICVIIPSKMETPPHAFCVINKNLNRGLVGSDVFLCYKKSMNSARSLVYKPQLLVQYPNMDRADFAFPRSVPIFCLPMGATLEAWPVNVQRPSPIFSTFVLTVSDAAEKVYGSAVTFYEPYPADRVTAQQRHKLRVQCEENSPTGDPPASPNVEYHTNKCLCLLSHWPFFHTFEKFLLFLYKTSLETEPQPVENEEDHKLLDLEDSQRSERTVFIMPPEPAPGSHAVYSYQQLLELEIQEAFLRFMASVLKGYRGYLLPIIKAPTVGATDTSSLFDLEGVKTSAISPSSSCSIDSGQGEMLHQRHLSMSHATPDSGQGEMLHQRHLSMSHATPATTTPSIFIDDVPLDDPQLEQPTTRTQMFIRFIEERSLVSDMDTGLAFFDECTEKVAVKLAAQCASAPELWGKCLLSTCHSIWFIHLPSYIAMSESKVTVLRSAYELLAKAQKYGIHPSDEVCYRVMMQLCGLYSQPVLAVKLLFLMRRCGIQPNAITYGFYNRAVLEAKWSSEVYNSSQLLWNKLRNVILAAALLRRAGQEASMRRLQLSNDDISHSGPDLAHDVSSIDSGQGEMLHQRHRTNLTYLLSIKLLMPPRRNRSGSCTEIPYVNNSAAPCNPSNSNVNNSSYHSNHHKRHHHHHSNKPSDHTVGNQGYNVIRKPTTTNQNNLVGFQAFDKFRSRVGSIVKPSGMSLFIPTSTQRRQQYYESSAGLLMTDGTISGTEKLLDSERLDSLLDNLPPPNTSLTKCIFCVRNSVDSSIGEECSVRRITSSADSLLTGGAQGASSSPLKHPVSRTLVTENDPLGALEHEVERDESMVLDLPPASLSISRVSSEIELDQSGKRIFSFITSSFCISNPALSSLAPHRSPAKFNLPNVDTLKINKEYLENALYNFSPSGLTSRKSNEILLGGLNSLKTVATSVAKKYDEIKEAISANNTPVKANGGDRDSGCGDEDPPCVTGLDTPRRKISSEFMPSSVSGHVDYWGSNLKDLLVEGISLSRKGSTTNLQQPLGESTNAALAVPDRFLDKFFARTGNSRDASSSLIALEVVLVSCSRCHQCSSVLPLVVTDSSASLNSALSSEDSSDPIAVPYLNPLVLRKELESILNAEGDECLQRPEFVDQHPIIYWNLVSQHSSSNESILNAEGDECLQRPASYHLLEFGNVMHSVIASVRCSDLSEPLKRLSSERHKMKLSGVNRALSLYREILFLAITEVGRENINQDLIWFFERISAQSHLPGLALNSKVVLAQRDSAPFDSSWLHCDHRNVFVRTLWDNPRLYDEVGQPLYILWTQNEKQSSLVSALVTDRTNVPRR
ncbi:DENN domain-containing protein Crag-like [Diaphorina citri]|uniref:DENN domain-containing protein Crag-like n=1 Tax=Diaphorina citri TaxID=121845 RepID=A0A3Q0J5Q2_DIACI|nr:DENN domain-containing protein Crag-like [Diaphorina citri]